MSSFSRTNLASAVVLSLIACGLAIFLVWTCFRGFGIWDEGLYLIMSLHPEDMCATSSSYYYYTGFLFRLCNYDIATFRILGLALLLAATVLLSTGLRAIEAFSANRTESAVGFLEALSFLLTGAFVYYGSFALTTPSYNLLNSLLLTATVATTSHALARAAIRFDKRAVAWMFFTGLLTGIDALVKMPSAALIFLAVSTATVSWPGIQRSGRYRLLTSCALGVLAWLVVHFSLIESCGAFATRIQRSRQYEANLGIALTLHDIFRYLRESAQLIWEGIMKSWPASIAVVLLLVLLKLLPQRRRGFLTPLCWATTLVAVYAHLHANYHQGGYQHTDNVRHIMEFYLFWAIALLFSVLILRAFRLSPGKTRESGALQRKEIILLATLAVVPFIGAIGTHNFIGYNLPMTLATWFALLLYLLARIEEYGLPLRIPVQIAIAAFAAAQLVTAYLTAEYGAYTGVAEQRIPTTLGDPQTKLLLDQETCEAIKSIQQQAEGSGFKKGDAILGFYQVPGLVYALGGRAAGLADFMGSYTQGVLPSAAHEAVLATLPYNTAHNAYVLTSLDRDEAVPNLQTIGRTFPNDYDLCAETVWPALNRTVRLWKPRADLPLLRTAAAEARAETKRRSVNGVNARDESTIRRSSSSKWPRHESRRLRSVRCLCWLD